MTKTMPMGVKGLIGVLAVVGAGCGAKGGATMTVSDFCSSKATKECDGVALKCLAQPDACKTARIAACTTFASQNLNTTTRPFRPELVQPCLDKASSVYSKTTAITPADIASLDDVCARVFSGKKKMSDTDATCTNTYDCDTSQICDPFFKTCAPLKTVGAGAGCNNPGEDCPTGQYCTGSPRKCVAKVASGLACVPDTTPCLEAFYCTSAGLCADRVTPLVSCTADSECVAAAPYCDPYNGHICTLGFTPSGGSAECIAQFGATGAGTGDGGGG